MDDDDMAQGQLSLRAKFHMCHVIIAAKSSCAKFAYARF